MQHPQTFAFKDDGAIPNSSLPLLVYRAALPADPAEIERVFNTNDWPAAWRNGVYPFHHFHANAHEVLGVASGKVDVQFGGPQGQVVTVRAGDVVVIPAGVGHCNKGQSADLLIVGAYPAEAPAPDLHKGDPAEHDRLTRLIAAIGTPSKDPVVGDAGPLMTLWAPKPGQRA